MERLIRQHRLSPAMVVACLALVVALGGTGYAAFNLPAGSVGAKQLKRSAVVNKKIAKNAVTGAKVKDDSLTGADVLESSLGKVPSAASADSATRASDAAHASSADSAANAANATNSGNANALNGYLASGLTRVAQTETVAAEPLTTSENTYGPPLSIVAPSQGFVLVTAAYEVEAEASCSPICAVFAHIRHTQTSFGSHVEAERLSNVFTRRTIPLTHVFPVSAGTNTFELRTSASGGAPGSMNAVSLELAGLFVPFGSTGGSTLGATK